MQDTKLATLLAQKQALEKDRAGVIAESVGHLDEPPVVKALDAYDRQIADVDKRIARHREGQTELGKAEAAAERAKVLRDSKAQLDQTVDACDGSVETDAAIDDHIRVLRSLLGVKLQ